MSESIQCNGNELESVLAGIRERDGFVASLETRVGKHNADYRVNYFERAEELAPPVAVRQSVDGTYCQQVNNPVALNQSAGEADSTSAGHVNTVGVGSAPMKNVSVPVVDVEHAGSSFPHQCETPANPAAPEAVKGAVAPRDPFKMTTKSLVIGQPVGQKPSGAETVGVDFSNRPGCTETAPLVSRDDLSIETPLPHCPTCSGHVTQGLPCPICAGIERIRDGARKLRNRFRPSTREARIPHND